MENYEEFLKKNENIINFIKNNNIENEIYNANQEAEKLASIIGKKYIHSYLFSKVYDILEKNNLSKENNLSQILELLENSFNKNINEIIRDLISINNGISDDATL